MNHTDPWPRLQALPASRRGECLAPKRAAQVRGKNIENATLLRQNADFHSKMRHIHCLLHKDYANICSNGGLFADLAADINY